MIQGNGTIQIGVSTYINPLINVYYNNSLFRSDIIVVAQICQPATENTPLTAVLDILNITIANVIENTFEAAQAQLLLDLRAKYTDCEFTIIDENK
jgi:hypothetical protein